MKLHERTLEVSKLKSELALQIVEFQQEHGLTDIETLQALAQTQDTILKYMLREERHPGEDMGADEGE